MSRNLGAVDEAAIAMEYDQLEAEEALSLGSVLPTVPHTALPEAKVPEGEARTGQAQAQTQAAPKPRERVAVPA